MLTIQCRRNPIRPVDGFNCRDEPSMFNNVIQPRHNGSVAPKNFTSIQGMRVRNHCLLLSHEVMAIFMLMTLSSSLWSHPATIATPISHLIACNNGHSDNFPDVIMYCRTESLQDKEIDLAQMTGYGLIIPGSDVVGLGV